MMKHKNLFTPKHLFHFKISMKKYTVVKRRCRQILIGAIFQNLVNLKVSLESTSTNQSSSVGAETMSDGWLVANTIWETAGNVVCALIRVRMNNCWRICCQNLSWNFRKSSKVWPDLLLCNTMQLVSDFVMV